MYETIPFCMSNMFYMSNMFDMFNISLGDNRNCASSVGFRWLVPLFLHLCPLSVTEVGVCMLY